MRHRIDARANGQTLDVRAGDEIQLELGENPTTGYRWHVDAAADPLELSDSSYVPEGSGVGAGGRRTLTFRAVRPGAAVLRLSRARTREEAAAAPADRFELAVRVGP